MTVSRQDSGRVLQKRRTRRAIIVAASGLLAAGRRPTVADAADAAEVSRATAYRYFPSRAALLREAALESTHPDIRPALDAVPRDDVLARFDVVCRTLFDRVVAAEAQMRHVLQVTQEDWLARETPEAPIRQGRRLDWIEQALQPLRGRLPPAAFARLVNSLATVIGIEAYTVLRDICGLEHDAVRETMRWAGRALIGASMPRPRSRRE
jgi:AcrR family transcriptional regulator